MIIIKTPATTANLGVGFDTLGCAFSLYNEYRFEESDTFILEGFPKEVNNEDNLIIEVYKLFARKNAEKVIPVKVTLLKNEIPIARGLGSSASCILAAIIAANEIHHVGKTLEECAMVASLLEGHSDNIFACAFGGLVASFTEGLRTYHMQQFEVHESLRFFALIPEKGLPTVTLRERLPKKVPYIDAVFNLQRMIFLPDVFKSGNLVQLKALLKDQLHEKYRYETIPNIEKVKALTIQDDIIGVISGSGPTMLFISDYDLRLDDKDLVELKIAKGIEVTVL